MNSLINDLAPIANMNLGEGFADLWNQYTPEQYAFRNNNIGQEAFLDARGGDLLANR